MKERLLESDDGGMVALCLEDVPYGFPDPLKRRFEVLGSATTHVDGRL